MSSRSQFLRRIGVVALAAGAVGLLVDGVLVLLYLRPIGAPIGFAGLLFSIFLLASMIVLPCLGIFWLVADRRKWGPTLITLSLFGFAITLAALDVSYGRGSVDLGNSHTELTLDDGWVCLNKHCSAAPTVWSGCIGTINSVIWSVELPLLVPAGLFAMIPAVELRRWVQRRRRRRSGVCEDCGYDLRGAMRTCSACGTHIGRCPECGIVVAQAGRFHAAALC